MNFQSPVHLTAELAHGMAELGMPNSYIVAPARGLDYQALHGYWSAVEAAGLLDLRFPEKPVADLNKFVAERRLQDHEYYVIHCGSGQLVGEFSLENFMGKAAQVHFSMHPDNEPSFNVELASCVADQLLYQWKDFRDLSRTFLDTLLGLTPIPNRAACIFVLRAGFEKLGVLPSSMNYLGEVVDTMVSVRVRH